MVISFSAFIYTIGYNFWDPVGIMGGCDDIKIRFNFTWMSRGWSNISTFSQEIHIFMQSVAILKKCLHSQKEGQLIW
jgi:hypothetical protein